MKLDICIVTQLHPWMNPRVVKGADALIDAGYTVGVIAPDFSEWGRSADREFKHREWTIIERPRFGPLSAPHVRIPELARRTIASFAFKALGCTHPAIVRAAWHPIAPGLVKAAKRHKARLYIAHMASSLPAAAIAADDHGARYGFDAEDFHSGEFPDDSKFAHNRNMVHQIESRYLPGCAYVTAASPLIAAAYEERYKIRRPSVVLNTFSACRSALVADESGTAVPGPSIYWFSQTIGPDRGLECAIRAVAQARVKAHLYLRGIPARGFLRLLSARTSELGITDRVHILPPGLPSKMEQLAAAYDIGLVGETGGTLNRRIALTNKQFTYLLSGLPVVMSDVPAHRDFALQAEGAAFLYKNQDAGSLAELIDWLMSDQTRLAGARVRALRLGRERFNWETEKVKFIDLIKGALG